jgi:hypothetical protein
MKVGKYQITTSDDHNLHMNDDDNGNWANAFSTRLEIQNEIK